MAISNHAVEVMVLSLINFISKRTSKGGWVGKQQFLKTDFNFFFYYMKVNNKFKTLIMVFLLLKN